MNENAKVPGVLEDDQGSDFSNCEHSSVDSISSIDEKGAEFLYKGDHKTRFDAINVVRSRKREADEKRQERLEAMKTKNSFVSRCKNFICCRGGTKPTSKANLAKMMS